MPKMKTKSGAKKRFKVTGSGKIKHSKAFKRHILEHKNAKRGRRLRQMALVDKTNLPEVRRMLAMG